MIEAQVKPIGKTSFLWLKSLTVSDIAIDPSDSSWNLRDVNALKKLVKLGLATRTEIIPGHFSIRISEAGKAYLAAPTT